MFCIYIRRQGERNNGNQTECFLGLSQLSGCLCSEKAICLPSQIAMPSSRAVILLLKKLFTVKPLRPIKLLGPFFVVLN